jgi:hypothetical protein
MSNIDDVRKSANEFGVEVCKRLMEETGELWTFSSKVNYLDAQNKYSTNKFNKTGHSWSVFDFKSDQELDKLIETEYNEIIALYKISKRS